MENTWQFTPFAFIYLATGIVVLRISHQAWKRRRAPGARLLSMLMIAIAVWAIGDGLGQLTTELSLKVLFAKFSYLGIVATPVLYFAAMAAISQSRDSLDGRTMALMALVPAAALMLALTNEWHSLIWSEITLIESPVGVLARYRHGVGFWILVIYSYVLIFLGTVLLVRGAIVRASLYRVQALVLLLAALVPWLANWLYVSGLSTAEGFDPTVVAFALTGALVAWSLSRFDLFKVLPMARNTLVEALTDGVLVLDRTRLIVDINQAASDLLQVDFPVVGKELVLVSDLGRQLDTALDQAEATVVEVPLIGDRLRYLEVQIIPLRHNRTEFLGHLLVMHDITARKSLENELRAALADLSERQLQLRELSETQQAILGSVHAAILTVAADGTILSSNAASERIFGFSTHALNGGVSFDALFDRADIGLWVQDRDSTQPVALRGISTLTEHLKKLKRTGGPLIAEATFRRKSGETFPGLVSVTAVVAGGASLPHSFVVLVNDISLQKQVETNLLLSEDRLRRANLELARALHQKDNFLAMISHELRTPLTVILGMSELLEEQIAGNLVERQLRYIQTIRSSGHHLLELINNILDLQRMEQGELEPDIRQVEIETLSRNSLDLIGERAAQKAQELSLFLEPDVPPQIMVDEERLRQLLGGLLANAVKFTPHGGKLGLEVCNGKEEGTIAFSVWDNGIGIPPEEIPRLFRPFVQLDDALTRKQEGLGLGLILVYLVVRLLGGSIRVESEVGAGSRFTVVLPATPGGPGDKLSAAQSGIKQEGRPEHVLVIGQSVEESAWIGEVMERAGCVAHQATELGDPAIHSVLQNVRVLLLDIPAHVDHWAIDLRRIRSWPLSHGLRVVGLLSALTPDVEKSYAEAGVNALVLRPFTAAGILAAAFPARAERERAGTLSGNPSINL